MPARSKPAEQSRRSTLLLAPAVPPPFVGPEPSRSPSTSPRTSIAPPRARFRPPLAGIEAVAVGRRSPKHRAPPLSPPILLRLSSTRFKVWVGFFLPSSTSSTLFLLGWCATVARNGQLHRRGRAPPPARRPALRAEFLHHFRAHRGRPTLLEPPRPSFCRRPTLRRRYRRRQQAARACSVLGRAPLARAV